MQPDAHKRALIAGSIGNFIEWYEFAVYGFLATVIAKNFFQLEGEAGLTSLILTYASFAIAFFFRPLGAVVFGRIGDGEHVVAEFVRLDVADQGHQAGLVIDQQNSGVVFVQAVVFEVGHGGSS